MAIQPHQKALIQASCPPRNLESWSEEFVTFRSQRIIQGNSTGQQCSRGGEAGDQPQDSGTPRESNASVNLRPSPEAAKEDSLSEGVLSDQSTIQLLVWLEMMELFVQTLSKNPQALQRLLEQNDTVANHPESVHQIRAHLPTLGDITRRPEFTSALRNPRVLSAIRGIKREMDTIRREAPTLLDALRGVGAADEHSGEAGAAQTSTPSQLRNSERPQSSSRGVSSDSVDPELLYQLYEDDLSKLIRMGFSNKTKNLEALHASNGSMDAAVEFLLNASHS
ncbi:hypothetical protein Y032_0012g1680 [Ancylostoma ceylanicum]|uniref:UBA domain-containing protein n=1 Tax=Ancylostoma ceylanicum TaxID=53326 RepID=A0A016VBR0_9BILA|nr:hypothetical protein Y032_0012g1680 [Ancylostoma ceylanicum]